MPLARSVIGIVTAGFGHSWVDGAGTPLLLIHRGL